MSTKPNDRSEAALRERLELAEKATPKGEKTIWTADFASPHETCVRDAFTERILTMEDYTDQATAAHIAASSPDVVREDIEEILRLRGENKLLNSMVMSFAGKAVHETVGGWWTGWKGEKFLTKKAAIMSLIVKVKSELK